MNSKKHPILDNNNMTSIFQKTTLGRAYYGDRNVTPESWSALILKPLDLNNLSPIRIKKQINYKLVTYKGCNLSKIESKNMLQHFPFWEDDTVKEDWIVLPITCEDEDAANETVVYTLTFVQLTDLSIEEESVNLQKLKKNLEMKYRTSKKGSYMREGKEEADEAKYIQLIQQELQEPMCVTLEFEINPESIQDGGPAVSFFPKKNTKRVLENPKLCLIHGLNLSNSKSSTHQIVHLSTDTNVTTTLPSSLLSDVSVFTAKETKNGRNLFAMLQKLFIQIIEKRQTNILSTSMRLENLNALYCVPSSLGDASGSGPVCRVAQCNTSTTGTVGTVGMANTESTVKTTNLKTTETTKPTHTLMYSDGSVEYNVSRKDVELSSLATKSERAYLNVAGTKVSLTLEGKLPYNSKHTQLSISTKESKPGKEEILLTTDFSTSPYDANTDRINQVIEQGAIKLNKQDIDTIVAANYETGVVRLMPSLHVGDRVRTSESPNIYHRGTIKSVNNNTYVLKTSNGTVHSNMKRNTFFIEREMEMKLAQVATMHKLTQLTQEKVIYPSEPLGIGSNVIVRVNVCTLLPSSTGTLLLLDTITNIKQNKNDTQKKKTDDNDSTTVQYMYTTSAYGNQIWIRRGYELNPNHSIPNVTLLHKYGIHTLLVSTLQYSKRKLATVTTHSNSLNMMSIRMKGETEDEIIKNGKDILFVQQRKKHKERIKFTDCFFSSFFFSSFFFFLPVLYFYLQQVCIVDY